MLEAREEIRTSKGHQALTAMFDNYFDQDYTTRKITCDDLDPTSFDFQLSVGFSKLKGINIGAGNSGPRQMFRMGGNGSINMTIPKKDGISILTSGERGDGLIGATNSECLCWKSRIDNLEEAKYYFDVLKKYYDNL